MLVLGNATGEKYYCRGKGSIGLNEGRRRKKPVPRAATGYAQQQKIEC